MVVKCDDIASFGGILRTRSVKSSVPSNRHKIHPKKHLVDLVVMSVTVSVMQCCQWVFRVLGYEAEVMMFAQGRQ